MVQVIDIKQINHRKKAKMYKTHCKSNKIKFQDLDLKNVIAAFDGGNITSDAGALILREMDKANDFIKDFSLCFTDYRDQNLIEHKLEELLKQRIFSICLGYEDLNDHDELRCDPLLATACDKKDPLGNDRENERNKGKALAGKSTLNRLELSGTGDLSKQRYKKITADFDKIENYFVDKFLNTYPKTPKEIIIDVDATDDLIHGDQEGKYSIGLRAWDFPWDSASIPPEREAERSCGPRGRPLCRCWT